MGNTFAYRRGYEYLQEGSCELGGEAAVFCKFLLRAFSTFSSRLLVLSAVRMMDSSCSKKLLPPLTPNCNRR